MQTLQRWTRKVDVKIRYNANDRQLSEMQAAGFPKPHYFGPRSPRWSVDELDDFDRRILAGEVTLSDADAAAELTRPAREKYAERVRSGDVRASRQATAARKRAVAEVAA